MPRGQRPPRILTTFSRNCAHFDDPSLKKVVILTIRGKTSKKRETLVFRILLQFFAPKGNYDSRILFRIYKIFRLLMTLQGF